MVYKCDPVPAEVGDALGTQWADRWMSACLWLRKVGVRCPEARNGSS